MNKKGEEILKREVGSILIALLCLLVLVGLIAVITTSFLRKSDLDKAQKHVDVFAREYNDFIKSNKQNEEFTILGPKDWWITSFDKEEGSYPEECEDFRFCACICKYDCWDGSAACAEIDIKFVLPEDFGYFIKEVPFSLKLNRL
jgi:hypothetical protein